MNEKGEKLNAIYFYLIHVIFKIDNCLKFNYFKLKNKLF